MKKNFLLLFLSAGLLTATQTRGQGTFIFDQQSSNESYYGEGGADIQQNQPLGQSFTPSLSAVGFVRIFIYNGLFGNYSQADIVVNLRSNSVSGSILGISSTVTIPGGSSTGGPTDFIFTVPVSVTPGITYYFQPQVLNNNNLGLNQSINYNYPGGMLFAGGVSYPNNDIWFREGIIVPEPSALALLFIGGGMAVWRLRRNHPRR